MAKKSKVTPGPPKTLDQDIEGIGQLLETLVDELAILEGLDPRVRSMYGRGYTTVYASSDLSEVRLERMGRPWLDVEPIRRLLAEKRLKGARDRLHEGLRVVREDIEKRLAEVDEECRCLADGTDISGRWRSVFTLGYGSGRGTTIFFLREMPYDTIELNGIKEGNREPQYLERVEKIKREWSGLGKDIDILEHRRGLNNEDKPMPDETVLPERPQLMRRPVERLDPRHAAPALETIKKLTDTLRDAYRRHKDPTPIYMQVLKRIAGKGPVTLRDVCKLTYEVQKENGGDPHSSAAKHGMADALTTKNGILSKVKNPIQGGYWNSSLNSVWEIPADFELVDADRPRKKRTAKELKALREGIVKFTEKALEVLLECSKPTERWELNASIGKKMPDHCERWHELTGDADERTIVKALRERWPDATSDWGNGLPRSYLDIIVWTHQKHEKERLDAANRKFEEEHGIKG